MPDGGGTGVQLSLYLHHARAALPGAHPLPRLVPGGGPLAVVDDDLRFIRMVERALATEGIRVQPVTTLDVDEAVRVIVENRCQAAFVDLLLYGEALGFTLVERLRQHPATRHLPIAVTSGARRELGRHVDFLRRHRCAVLLKPFSIARVLDALRPGDDS